MTTVSNNYNYEPLKYLCDALAYCVYQIANNAETLTESECSEPDEGNYDLCLISRRNCIQTRDVLIVQRDSLIALINEHLNRISNTSIQIQANKEYPSDILLLGDDNSPEFSVDFVTGHYISDRKNKISDDIFLFFPQSDFGEIPHMQVDVMAGEFWQLKGNIALAKSLWPFRINYAGECIALSECNNIIVCENREK